MPQNQKSSEGQEKKGASSVVSVPSISLPKGGGAVRGIGEKFAANPVTGTGSMTIPIATSPGRAGFGPQLNLSYDSGSGNGIFGLGWNLSIPSITRKTDKGLPQYFDTVESDVFILSGAEDLVPVFKKNDDGTWAKNAKGEFIFDDEPIDDYSVRHYCPRVEGLFARIERWTKSDGDVHWRSISKDNILTLYGKDDNSRIFDPDNHQHVFSWLICEIRDDKGNAVIYEYKSEDVVGVDLAQAHEHNRGDRDNQHRNTNRYIKHIYYGNRVSLVDTGIRPRFLLKDKIDVANWMLEVVFDYGEHNLNDPKPDDGEEWLCRNDPFSSYRAGFEVRTYRLCQRILMFHYFPGEVDVGQNCLVRSTDFVYRNIRNDPEDLKKGHPVASFIAAVTQSGYKRQTAGGYIKKSLPPVKFEYSQVPNSAELAQLPIRDVDAESLENLPIGLDGSSYQWMDLDGEGTSGILTEQADGWFYKRNLSANNLEIEKGVEHAVAKFGAMEVIAQKPSSGLAGGGQFLDLAGDGQVDLAYMEGPVRGFYERTSDEGWELFQPFKSWSNVNTHDPNLKFVDLTGDGHADILITEGEALTWHPSLAEDGFGPSIRVSLPLDEEKGPRLVFADSTQSIYLADLSGDGLSDFVRIRNGEVCYWPNLGYGRFGAKVTMDNAPWFDAFDQFDQRRIRLADTDGSGTTDILYLHHEGVRIYFNQSGNRWSDPIVLPQFPPIDNIASIQMLDLLGNGTACLVWSSPLPGNARQPMRYIALMEEKPHLMIGVKNNLGAETNVKYAPSTKFYLQDKRDGKPWITRLPFPVHVVEKVTVTDKWRKTTFSSTYSYHHGYFDGTEREFRGFGRVDQVDCESYGEFENGNADSPYITPEKMLYQPPVKTVTWYHTGAALDRKHILTQFEHEYFPHWFEEMRPNEVNVLGNFSENILPEPDLTAENLSSDEWRESLRACKGMVLRQEVYELDVDALEMKIERPVKLFTSAYHNCHIKRLQARGKNRHAVFLATESEAITYHYELDLTRETVYPDPRIAHTLNLKQDDFGNILQSVAVVYPRIGKFEDKNLAESLALIQQVQQERHLAYTETRYTDDFIEQDNYRLRVPCEVLTYELTGIIPEDASDIASPDPRNNLYFTLDELRRFRLSAVHQDAGEIVSEIAYHQLPNRTIPEKRLVEQVQMLFFDENLKDHLPLGQVGRLGLAYETYKLSLTEELLAAIFPVPKLDECIGGTVSARELLRDKNVSGYLYRKESNQYWMCSGIAGFASDAADHFYLPECYIDPFENKTTLKYDALDLFIESSTDVLGNTTSVKRFDFRVLAPCEMKDINDNLSEVYFDILGLPVAMTLKGKGNEADDLSGITDDLANPELSDLIAFFNLPDLDKKQAYDWLGRATARYVYYFGETYKEDGTIAWATHPPCVCGILREQHTKQNENSPLQAAFEYSDGMGSVLVKKVQAESEGAGKPLRWVASGKTVLNNKGKPVKQYEPYFSAPQVGHRFEEPREEGVTPVIYYDAVGRTVCTEMPDGSYSRVEFSPWHVTSYDQNDTAYDPNPARMSDWYRRHMDSTHPRFADFNSQENVRAAKSVEAHANTPALTILDSLGREVISVAHNRVNGQDEKYLTFTKMDAEGKPLWIRDARGNLVMQYIMPPVPNNQIDDPLAGFSPCYDIAGNLLFHHSMDAGERWMLNDAVGKPMFAWDSRGHSFRTEYDALHRPMGSFVKGIDPTDVSRVTQFEKIIYGDTPGNGLSDDQRKTLNLRGKPYQHFDTAGIVTYCDKNKGEGYDFKGNLLRSTRQLVSNYINTPDWFQSPPLETEIFENSSTYDALNRPFTVTSPDGSIYCTTFNAGNLLEKINVNLRGVAQSTPFVRNIDYNAKGQRTRIEYNQDSQPIITEYSYDLETFRLTGLITTRPLYADAKKRKLQHLSYTYDPVGNITHISDQAQPLIFFDNACIEPSNDYRYDALYRLEAASGREHKGQNLQPDWDDRLRMGNPIPYNCAEMQRYVEVYRYDQVGNILRMAHYGGSNLDAPGNGLWNRRYQYALVSNRLLATSVQGDQDNLPDYTATPGYHAPYAYDLHGNMASMPHLSLEWDFKDQLLATQQQIVANGETGEKTWYVYDASGQRVRKVTERQNGTRKDERLYLGAFEIYRAYNGGTEKKELERETLHIMDDKQRIALVETHTQGSDPAPQQLIRFQFGNHLGSAVLELDHATKVISYEEYYPYGSTAYQAMHNQTETPKRYRYTGKERDDESGLYYHGARYYAPWLGRWTSCDSVGLMDGPDLYVYVRSAPINQHDPTGFVGEPMTYDEFQTSLQDVAKEISQSPGEIVAKDRRTGTPAKHIAVDPLTGTEAELANTTPTKGKGELKTGPYRRKDVRGHHVEQSAAHKNRMGKDPMRQGALAVSQKEGALAQPKAKSGHTNSIAHERAGQVQSAIDQGRLGNDVNVTLLADPKGKLPEVSIHAHGNGKLPGGPCPSAENVKGYTALLAGGAHPEDALNASLQAAEERKVAGMLPSRIPGGKWQNVKEGAVKLIEKIAKSKGGKAVVVAGGILAHGVAKAAPIIGTVVGAADVVNEAQTAGARRATLAAVGMSEIPIVSQVADIGLAVEDASWAVKDIIDPEQKAEAWAHKNLSFLGF